MSCDEGCCRDASAVMCGCCEGLSVVTPASVRNRPGLPALAYRVGTHAAFLESMLARISTQCLGTDEECAGGQGVRPLAALATRDPGDPAVALMDAWAAVADVLAFYQERIANEGYLRTATERRSILELARLVGYRLRPGVAASTYLAYTIDPNVTEPVTIRKGARVQSVPGPGETPQSFETSEDVEARAPWSLVKPRQTEPQTWQSIRANNELYVKGVATNLKANDPILIDPLGGDRPLLYRIVAVEPQPALERTRLAVAAWPRPLVSEVPGAVANVLDPLIAAAPDGVIAKAMVAHMLELREVAQRVTTPDALADFMATHTAPLLAGEAGRIPANATTLRTWARDMQKQFDGLLAATRDAAQAAAVEPGAGGLDGNRLGHLVAPGSVPKASGLQLRRDLATIFKTGSDAGLQMVAAAVPDARGGLAAALAGYTGTDRLAAPKVYALRVKAGVFGQGFPKQTQLQRTPATDTTPEVTSTKIVGEWPIVLATTGNGPFVVSAALEDPETLYLDGSYEGIAPGSWVVLDFSAVPVPKAGTVLIEPEVFPLDDAVKAKGAFPLYGVVRADRVSARISRSAYGMTASTTRIDLAGPWMRFDELDKMPPLPQAENAVAPEAFVRPEPARRQDIIDADFAIIRATQVYAQSELLDLVERPIVDDVCVHKAATDVLELDGLYASLQPGRFVIVSGERTDIPDTTGVAGTEAAMIAQVLHDLRAAGQGVVPLSESDAKAAPLAGDRTHTFLRLDKALTYCYRRDTTVLYANVVKATHGETRQESLGGGDAAKAMQSFTLKQRPLTYVAAPTPAGARSELDVFVNDVRWHEQETFAGRSPTDHAFVVDIDDDAQTAVTFGNGAQGARLPTGIENVKAVYRNGIGKVGNVRAKQLTLLVSRPLGVKDVVNPLPATGGADRETRDAARDNVPVGTKALDRLVSVRDYQDFARAFAGIGKASAAALSDGHRHVVHVTIAGADDIPIDPDSDLFRNLYAALGAFGDPLLPIVLATRALRLIVLSAGVHILPDYQWEPVVTAVRAALLDALGFARRQLGEDVQASEAQSAMQAVAGVDYVDLDVFDAVDTVVADAQAAGGWRPRTPDEITNAIEGIVTAAAASGPSPAVIAKLAQPGADGIRPAELAILSPDVPGALILNQLP